MTTKAGSWAGGVPEVPPNADWFFFKHAADDGRECCWMGVGAFAYLDEDLNEHNRKIIAAVAECAWLREAEKWANTPVNDCKNFDDIAQWKAEAEANAKAWRQWSNHPEILDSSKWSEFK